MRILVLTVIMSFLSHSAFGAEGGGAAKGGGAERPPLEKGERFLATFEATSKANSSRLTVLVFLTEENRWVSESVWQSDVFKHWLDQGKPSNSIGWGSGVFVKNEVVRSIKTYHQVRIGSCEYRNIEIGAYSRHFFIRGAGKKWYAVKTLEHPSEFTE